MNMMNMDLSEPQLLRLPEVQKLTGLSRSSIYAAMKEDRFPSSVKLTRHAIAWRRSDVISWIENLTETQAA